ncbi:ABC transporter substrate-binding protein [Planctomonas psychrotolerans]|uniref:ABC transporter substrate-binding protein n=1 Tax=Planctomonas psychrotolerans TaxID=2528712 RepID=UPI001239AD99|nr:ABC transporter substrate-binding protein [Planctomonas psychrotolerans]
MSSTLHRRRLVFPLAAASAVALTLAGCTGDIAAENAGDADCSDYEAYGDFTADSPEVNVYGTIVEVEADRLNESWIDFETCTGIDVVYEGSQQFETQINVRAQGGNPPDLAIIPQPGLFASLARDGYLQPAPEAVESNVDEFWSADWKAYGTVEDEFYGAPLMASIKGYIWYSPSFFEENGYEQPESLDELMTLTQQIADDGVTPWCAGFASDAATGWPGTDWVEDMVLRLSGPEVYDQWVAHEIPFNDPQIVEAFDAAGDILKNPEYVNGGHGGVESIVSLPFGEGGLPILDNECAMHHQATFYEGFWPEDTNVAEDGDVWAFLTPPAEAGGENAVTGGGEIVGAFTDSEEVVAVQTFLSSDTWANNRVSLGGVISANSGLDPANASSDLLSSAVETLQSENTVFRFDASDLMPAAVGANSFFKGMVDWIGGDSSEQVATFIEGSWPAS